MVDIIQVVIFMAVIGVIVPIIINTDSSTEEEIILEDTQIQQYETSEIKPQWTDQEMERSVDVSNGDSMLDMAENDFLWQQKMKQDCIAMGLTDC